MSADTNIDINSVIRMFNEHKEFKSIDWRIGFRNALKLVLSDNDYSKFLEMTIGSSYIG